MFDNLSQTEKLGLLFVGFILGMLLIWLVVKLGMILATLLIGMVVGFACGVGVKHRFRKK